MRSQRPRNPSLSAQQPAPQITVAGLSAESTPLSRLIHLLSGDDPISLADTGITPLCRDRLDAIAGNASHEGDNCLACAQLLLSLMETTLENDCPPDNHQLLSLARHVLRLLRDQQRWHTLADNAAYYRDHPQVAARIAAARAGNC
ncbi:hypothetical protein [Pseudoxanthomonas dokdonensis]|nr:hypothetical protein [Pseudoxanthomonas dokdonensis]